MITVTEQAGRKIKELMASEEGENLFLRVGVKAGGCSGFSYGMGFDHEKQDDDQEFVQQGVKILVDSSSAKYLEGVEIDYKESMMGGGFTIHNPNAVATCGCGSSFRTKEEAGNPTEC
ncbi:iron-sulfur cluster insertion protein ErpA [Microaerobacter geothermalis]|uniref:iron-sulfur cluster insertion protein ErpA n=1 Tax=Microaerobacter geothermalis TaxID=674972 RepID=UPI001EFF08DE|nr:iron-sulfur cluster insertion protein ErpA [Microaerobacter geothermalis]MCF6092456.1 iron-sulfur cluster insertion protein ErpA [Microaerobacter geothermalis]